MCTFWYKINGTKIKIKCFNVYLVLLADVDGRIILRQMLGKWDMGVWTGLGWLGIETDGVHS
jgi:hypothetical protein